MTRKLNQYRSPAIPIIKVMTERETGELIQAMKDLREEVVLLRTNIGGLEEKLSGKFAGKWVERLAMGTLVAFAGWFFGLLDFIKGK